MNYYDFYFDKDELNMIKDVQVGLEETMSTTEARIAIHYSTFIKMMKENAEHVMHFGCGYWIKRIKEDNLNEEFLDSMQ